MEKISVKALVDKESNKIIFIESGSDFIDVLFSLLTIPLGRIVSLACNHSVPMEIGCIKNLYQSIEKTDVHEFRSTACKDMLLLPGNAAESHCKNLKLKIDIAQKVSCFVCCHCRKSCCCFTDNIRSHMDHLKCPSCQRTVWWERVLVNDSQVGGIFVKGRPRLIITDDLQVIPPVGSASISLFSKLGVSNKKATEEMTFDIGADEVLSLLMNSLVSKTPLTETLLKHKPAANFGEMNSNQGMTIESQVLGDMTNEEERTIAVKLIVSKSKKMVCYAEAREDFVNLICSFLALPLGFILEKMRNCSWEGCIDQLYKSVQGLDEQYLKSKYHKELLVNPKLAPRFCYENLLLGIQEASFYNVGNKITTDESEISENSVKIDFVDPKSCDDKDESTHGFFKGPALFTVTDNLVVRQISPIFAMSVLEELKVPFTDIEDQTVHVGKKEALRLLVASFVGGNALTNAFLKNLREPKQEQ